MPKFVFVVGPTASGKSERALRWAEMFNAEIINADSVQMYEGLDIGSAKPSDEDFRRVPHHLFSWVHAPDSLSVGDYHRAFEELVASRESAVRYLVVGGTGFYFQALEKGLPKVPAARMEFQQALFQRWKEDPRALEKDYLEFCERDPVAAQRIHINDHYRLSRALDLIDSTGQSVTEVWAAHAQTGSRFSYPLLKVGLWRTRAQLEPRVKERTRKMLAAGLVEETRGLLQRGLRDWEPLRSVGYRECVEYLEGGESGATQAEKGLAEKIDQNTLRLAKKQITWFRRDSEIQWDPDDSVLENFFAKD